MANSTEAYQRDINSTVYKEKNILKFPNATSKLRMTFIPGFSKYGVRFDIGAMSLISLLVCRYSATTLFCDATQKGRPYE